MLSSQDLNLISNAFENVSIICQRIAVALHSEAVCWLNAMVRRSWWQQIACILSILRIIYIIITAFSIKLLHIPAADLYSGKVDEEFGVPPSVIVVLLLDIIWKDRGTICLLDNCYSCLRLLAQRFKGQSIGELSRPVLYFFYFEKYCYKFSSFCKPGKSGFISQASTYDPGSY